MVLLSLKTKLVTPRVAETRDFYRRCFGLELVEEWDEPGDMGCILAFPQGHGEAYLEIYAGEVEHDFSGVSLQFRVADIAAFQASLPPDVPARGPVERPWGSTYLYLEDPNGMDVIIYEGGF